MAEISNGGGLSGHLIVPPKEVPQDGARLLIEFRADVGSGTYRELVRRIREDCEDYAASISLTEPNGV